MRYEELLSGKGQDNRFVWGDIVSLLFWLMQEHLHFENFSLKNLLNNALMTLQFLYACFTLLEKCSKISRGIRGNKLTTYHSEASLIAQLVKNPPSIWETWVRSLGWEDPLEKGKATHSSILAWRISMDRGAWRSTVHRGTKSQTCLK